MITSQGGSAITVAESEAGQATSFAGAEITVASIAIANGTAAVTAIPTSSIKNAASSTRLSGLGISAVTATLGTMMGGALVGAFMVL